MARLVAITGGIGSGKSVVAQLLHVMGYSVYDCDSRAKQLMATSASLRERLIRAFGSEVFNGAALNREALAAKVFADKNQLAKLNSIVHPAVISDIREWADKRSNSDLFFVETALLRESGVERLADDVIVVTAPIELRIERVMRRNNASREQVEARIKAQGDFDFSDATVVVNDDVAPIIPQLISFLASQPRH